MSSFYPYTLDENSSLYYNNFTNQVCQLYKVLKFSWGLWKILSLRDRTYMDSVDVKAVSRQQVS